MLEYTWAPELAEARVGPGCELFALGGQSVLRILDPTVVRRGQYYSPSVLSRRGPRRYRGYVNRSVTSNCRHPNDGSSRSAGSARRPPRRFSSMSSTRCWRPAPALSRPLCIPPTTAMARRYVRRSKPHLRRASPTRARRRSGQALRLQGKLDILAHLQPRNSCLPYILNNHVPAIGGRSGDPAGHLTATVPPTSASADRRGRSCGLAQPDGHHAGELTRVTLT